MLIYFLIFFAPLFLYYVIIILVHSQRSSNVEEGMDLQKIMKASLLELKSVHCSDFTTHYQCCTWAGCITAKPLLLGKGGFGTVVAMKSVQNPAEPVRAVKKIRKANFLASIDLFESRWQQFKFEVGVLRGTHHSALSHCCGLYDDDDTIYLVLEEPAVKPSTLQSRLYELYLWTAPRRIDEVESCVEEAEYGRRACQSDVERSDYEETAVAKVARSLGAVGGVPLHGDLIHLMQYYANCQNTWLSKSFGSSLKDSTTCNSTVLPTVTSNWKNVVYALHVDATPVREGDSVVDVKLTFQIRCQLIDFGLAQVVSPTDAEGKISVLEPPVQSNDARDVPARLCGSHDYVPIDRYLCHAKSIQLCPISQLMKSDTYALGVVLYCLLAGTTPYKFKDVIQLEIVTRYGIALPSKVQRTAALDELMRRLTDPDPSSRYLPTEALLATAQWRTGSSTDWSSLYQRRGCCTTCLLMVMQHA